MKHPGPTNIPASVLARLRALDPTSGHDFQRILSRYANERVLARLVASPHAPRFILKGAMMFTVWEGHPHRPSKDLDFLGLGDPAVESIREVFRTILAVDLAASGDDDGITFEVDALTAAAIREEVAYGGVRVEVFARLGTARIKVQIDVGFGDAVTPGVAEVEFPTLLGTPALRVRAYPRETVVAEKLEAMVRLGLLNSRLKDYYDLATISQRFDVDGDVLVQAIRATFERRQMALPSGLPAGLTAAYFDDPGKRTLWTAFVRKSGLTGERTLPEVVAELVGFLAQPLQRAADSGPPWRAHWPASGPWRG